MTDTLCALEISPWAGCDGTWNSPPLVENSTARENRNNRHDILCMSQAMYHTNVRHTGEGAPLLSENSLIDEMAGAPGNLRPPLNPRISAVPGTGYSAIVPHSGAPAPG